MYLSFKNRIFNRLGFVIHYCIVWTFKKLAELHIVAVVMMDYCYAIENSR